ncbi:NUDIX hydrolase [Alteromonas sp. a30]|uniref:NUDIX hydrolase n=1 Tax=Alteromonas sp. a30 TaxID=2730917 RepID=UPI0022820303|nr:NUDIX hydrolase [Alteromonas sp. a30]MCY7296071.1 NUDIX hydrolase [Alteromonas sp. a30]
MKLTKALLAFTLLHYITACSYAPPSSPMCRIAKGQQEAPPANAGCIVRVKKRILAITHFYSGKFDLPAGTSADSDESAQCTAHRETWEETGFNVEVGTLLGIADSGMHFFACELDDDFDGLITEFPVPAWSETEVNAIRLINPFSTTPSEWRFPDQLIKIRDAFNKLGEIQSKHAKTKKAHESS